MKPLRFPLVLSMLAALTTVQAQQNNSSSNCPGVPGACGYPHSNQNVARTGNPAPQDGNGTLGVIFDMQKCGLDYAHASQRLGQRFTPAGVGQPAGFAIAGIPNCAVIEKAYLWVEGSGNGIAQTATVAGPFGTQNYPMTIVGQGPDKCWSYAGSYTYRADVTSIVQGNGTYNISGLATNPPTSGNDMDGASLMVIWSDASQAWAGRIVIADGAIVINGGNTTYNMPISPAVCGATTNARAFFAIGDIQMNPNSWDANGTPVPLGWNWWNFNEVSTTVAASAGSASYSVSSGGDCYNLCVTGLYFQTTTCTSCPTSASAMTVTASSTAATCSACDGTASVTNVTGGTPPYTYNWAPSGGTAQNATGLCAGTYTVTVGDATGCQVATQTVTVGSASGVTVTPTQANLTCDNSNDGTATVNLSGGTPPFTYAWTPNVSTTATATGLSAGSYTCTITDGTGCTTTQTFTITAPAALLASPAITDVACFGDSTGAITITTTGGTPNYNYTWSPNVSTTNSASNISAGSYTISVIDANGCSTSQSLSVTEPPLLSATTSSSPVNCAIQGSATVTPTGGTGTYSYSWAPSGGTGATESNLNVGTYTVTVTDGNGCTTTQSVAITQVATMSVTATSSDATCFGGSTGTASVTQTGGNGPYTYQWSPTGGNNASPTGLAAGTYTCLITDSQGCTATQTVVVSQPTQITGSSSGTSPTCNGATTGSAFITVSGGTGPYSYSWAPSGGTSANATGLGAGTYTCTVSDANGCPFTQTVTLTQPPAITATGTGNQVCPGSGATLLVTASGGTSPYTYSWSNGPATSTQTLVATLATAGVYTVTVTDANGCTQTATASLSLLATPTAAYTTDAANNVVILTGGTGTICFTDISTGAVAWVWDFNGQATSTQQSPCFPVTTANAGTFCTELTVTNSDGCVDTTIACVEVGQSSYSIPNVFTPNADGINDSWIITNEGMTRLHCAIYDRWGVLIYEWDGPTGNWDGRTTSGKPAVDGTYYFIAVLEDFTGKIYDEQGFFQLIR